jgi:hypothetical protein
MRSPHHHMTQKEGRITSNPPTARLVPCLAASFARSVLTAVRIACICCNVPQQACQRFHAHSPWYFDFNGSLCAATGAQPPAVYAVESSFSCKTTARALAARAGPVDAAAARRRQGVTFWTKSVSPTHIKPAASRCLFHIISIHHRSLECCHRVTLIFPCRSSAADDRCVQCLPLTWCADSETTEQIYLRYTYDRIIYFGALCSNLHTSVGTGSKSSSRGSTNCETHLTLQTCQPRHGRTSCWRQIWLQSR